jgi:minor histocompatibility antigen H13
MSTALLNLSYGLLFATWGLSYFVAIPVPVNLIISATTIVFIGSARSLRLLATEENGGVTQEDRETLSAADAYKFPLVGSAALFGLYLVFKYLDKDTVNLVLAGYFGLVGTFTMTNFLSKLFPSPKTAARFGFKKKFPYIGEVDLLFSLQEIFYLILSVIFSLFYLKTKHYMLNNIFGIIFCVSALERISIGSYKIGAILLVGLFFYDIFWVFGTDVMVTVAKSFDGPIKLLFPIKLPGTEGSEKGEFSLLGLGDIVVPGLFVALLLRFDAVRAKFMVKDGVDNNFPQPYFLVNIVFYAVGLLVTVGIMFFFKAAQPALLYLVPACLLSSVFTALLRGEFQALLAYDEEKAAEKIDATSVDSKKEQ